MPNLYCKEYITVDGVSRKEIIGNNEIMTVVNDTIIDKNTFKRVK
jgi:hypothetical protein